MPACRQLASVWRSNDGASLVFGPLVRHPSLAEFALSLEGFPASATNEDAILEFVRQSFGVLPLCWDNLFAGEFSTVYHVMLGWLRHWGFADLGLLWLSWQTSSREWAVGEDFGPWGCCCRLGSWMACETLTSKEFPATPKTAYWSVNNMS